MKKMLSMILAAVLLFTLGGVGALAADAEEMVGTYTLTAFDDGSGTDSEAMMEAMQALGLSATLEIREDGSAVLDLFGTEMELEFDFDAETATAEGDAVPFTYEDGVLEISAEGASMTFTQGDVQKKNGKLTFDYYVLDHYVDSGDEMTYDEGEELPYLYLFSDGSAIIYVEQETTSLVFDFDEMTASLASGEGIVLPVSLEDGMLTLWAEEVGDEENYIAIRQEDPGWAGPYVIYEISMEDLEDTGDDIDAMAAIASFITLTIDEDGVGTLSIFGETTSMTFDFDEMVVTDEEGDSEIPFTYENGVLTIAQEDEYMSFKRILSEEAAEELALALEESEF